MGSGIAEARNFFAATAADGSVGIVANLAAGEVGHVGIEQRRKGGRMRLLACPRRPSRMKLWRERMAFHDLRHHRVVVADDAGKDAGIVVLPQAGDEVVASSSFTRRGAKRSSENETAAQFAERARKTHEEPPGKILSWIIRGSAGVRASAIGLRASAIGLRAFGNRARQEWAVTDFTIRVTEVYRVNSVGGSWPKPGARKPKPGARSAPPTARVRCRRFFPGHGPQRWRLE